MQTKTAKRIRPIGLVITLLVFVSIPTSIPATVLAIGPGDTVASAKHLATIKPDVGFVDSPLAVDGTGRLAYVETDAAGISVVRVLELATQKPVATIDIGSLEAVPTSLEFRGSDLFVVGRLAAGTESGAILRGGSVHRRFGPATHVRLSMAHGKPVAVLHKRSSARGTTKHVIEARSLETGKRVGKRTILRLDASGRDSKRRYVHSHFRKNFLEAVGTHLGDYNRKADSRLPNSHAVLDIVSGKLAQTPIANVIEREMRLVRAAAHPNRDAFLEIGSDRRWLRATGSGWADGGEEVSLAEHLSHYEPSSLSFKAGPKGSLFFSIQIDPVHRDAAAKKRAVPDWIELYELRPGERRARRLARLLSDARSQAGAFRWVATLTHWVILPDHVGFSRGGPRLEVFEIK